MYILRTNLLACLSAALWLGLSCVATESQAQNQDEVAKPAISGVQESSAKQESRLQGDHEATMTIRGYADGRVEIYGANGELKESIDTNLLLLNLLPAEVVERETEYGERRREAAKDRMEAMRARKAAASARLAEQKTIQVQEQARIAEARLEAEEELPEVSQRLRRNNRRLRQRTRPLEPQNQTGTPGD